MQCGVVIVTLAVCGVQLLVVAGGYDGSILYTVELLRDYRTATSWVVATARLPRALYAARMTLVGPHLYLTGGQEQVGYITNLRTGECLPPALSNLQFTEILWFRPVEEDWQEVGNLDNARSGQGQVFIANPASICTGQSNISPGSKETAAAGSARDRN